MLMAQGYSKTQASLKPSHLAFHLETGHSPAENNGTSTNPSFCNPSESSGRKAVLTARELLETIHGFSMGYELDCRGWCEMPVVFQVFALVGANVTAPLDQELFRCRTSLPSTCDSTFVPVCRVTSPFIRGKTGKDCEFLKLKSGVHGKSWCASNDKVDVYFLEDNKETYIGLVVRKVTLCGYAWHLMNSKEELLYVIKNTGCTASTFCRCPCGRCERIKFIIKPEAKTAGKDGSIEKKWTCCCAKGSSSDNCKVEYPEGVDWIERALIMTACFWIHQDQFLKNACVF